MVFAYGYRSKETEEAAIFGTVGGLAGGLQTALLREYADIPMANDFLNGKTKTPPFLKKQLKGFGSPSSVLGWGIGTPVAIVGAVGLFKGRGIKHPGAASGLFGYGVTAAGTGIISGALPTASWKNAIKADPANPVGYVNVSRNNQISRQGNAAGSNVPSASFSGTY